MEETTLELLLGEINDSIGALKSVELGSEDYSAIVNDTCKLLDKATAMKKQMDDADIKREEAERSERIRVEEVERSERIRIEERNYRNLVRREDQEIRAMERREDRLEREADRASESESKNKNFMVECAKIAVPVLTTAALVLHDDRISKTLLKFEETGCLSTSWSRSFFGKILKRGK